jgi:hypothetical protein
MVERRFIPDRHRRSVVIFRACQDLGLLIQFKHRDSSSRKRLEGSVELAATEISSRKRTVANSFHDHGATRFVCVFIEHREFGDGSLPDPMIFPYLIPRSPRYSESYARVKALAANSMMKALASGEVHAAQHFSTTATTSIFTLPCFLRTAPRWKTRHAASVAYKAAKGRRPR